MGTRRIWRAVALLAAGMVLGVAIVGTPAGAHVKGTASHLWRKHIRPKTDKRYARVVASGTTVVDFGSMGSGACAAERVNPAGVGNISGDFVLVTSETSSDFMALRPRVDGAQPHTFLLTACNTSTFTIGEGVDAYSWAVLRVP